MRVAIHQPHFLPWAGYLNKLLHADVFVWLDTVQFRKNYFQNRTQIKGEHGAAVWLTIPVHAPLGTPIHNVTIADGRWRTKALRTLEQCYRKAPWMQKHWEPIRDSIASETQSLDEVNFRCLAALLRELGGPVPGIERMSSLRIECTDPTERLVQACRVLGATEYVAGRGGKNYLDEAPFLQAGIKVVWQNFDPASVHYAQIGPGFLQGLSVVDCLFNVGGHATRDLVMKAWTP